MSEPSDGMPDPTEADIRLDLAHAYAMGKAFLPMEETEFGRFIMGILRRCHAAEFTLSLARGEAGGLRAAIAEHHRQKADDRCIEDDDRLYVAAGLPPCDRRVGDKAAMLRNCERFIDRRCEGGGWPTYADLERRVADLEAGLRDVQTELEETKDDRDAYSERAASLLAERDAGEGRVAVLTDMVRNFMAGHVVNNAGDDCGCMKCQRAAALLPAPAADPGPGGVG